jgi:hypothetical protein
MRPEETTKEEEGKEECIVNTVNRARGSEINGYTLEE